ncbi:MAG: cyclopropane-fatty-acyl-phospholipid synthase family protein [Parcubacteria group bacterium]
MEKIIKLIIIYNPFSLLVRFILKKVWSFMGPKTSIAYKIIFADGSMYQNKPGEPEVAIIYKTSGAELNSVLFDHTGLFSSFINQTVDIKGDLVKMMKIGDDSSGSINLVNPLIFIRNIWHDFRFNGKTIKQAIKNAKFHYNLGTKLFRNYLDPTMTYTCAYWKEGTRNLEEAQRNKLDYVCRKLLLKPGETLVDVGSGWGSLLFHAYENYGVLGANYSPTPNQNEVMQAEINKRGYQDKIKIYQKDFREIKGRFDKYASLGVYEHASKSQIEDWIKGMSECLKDGGLGVLHFIANVREDYTDFFIRKYIFQGAYIPGLAETIKLMSKYGLEILDVENLRRHYALTLTEWAKNFEKNWEKIHEIDPKKFDEKFRRKWWLYLWSCAGSFQMEHTNVHLFQIIFSKGKVGKDYPMSREYLYK